jgi:outer membrane protein OmpA-like peptidoglycan-associated protein/tetratricopeptide (TPR) repeat protein
MKKLALLLLLFVFSATSFAQFNSQFRKKYQIAEGYINQDQFAQALPYFLELDALSPNNPNILFHIGACYVETKTELQQAKKYLDVAKSYVSTDYRGHFKETSSPIHTYLYLGRVNLLLNHFDEAILSFEKFLSYLTSDNTDFITETESLFNNAKNAKELTKNPISLEINNLGEAINTPWPEYAPVLSPDLSFMIFTSRRPESTGGLKDPTGKYFEDIYIADYYPETNTWENVRMLPGDVNTSGHEASISISWDGKTLFLYRDDKGIGNIYMSVLEGEEWGKPVKLSAPVNTKNYENHAFLSPDGKTLYFVSDRPGGYGKKDIWASERLGFNSWGTPVNLGPNINTQQDEDSPLMLSNGKSLYFSSKGHNGMGGYDIFISEQDENKQWGAPINIGYPINTTGDDIFFVPTLDGSQAFYATTRNDGFGDLDIYHLTINKRATTNIKGTVIDTISNKPSPANITVYNAQSMEVVYQTANNKETGEYELQLPAGVEYIIHIETETGTRFKDTVYVADVFAENIRFSNPYYLLNQDALTVDTLVRNVNFGKQVGQRYVLRNVHFDFDKATLRPESEMELNQLVDFLNAHPEIKIEISGHTDNKGGAEYNQTLSQNRAQAVTDYLVDKGISRDRLRYIGFGMLQPMASNDTDEGRQLNRRVEYRVMGVGVFDKEQQQGVALADVYLEEGTTDMKHYYIVVASLRKQQTADEVKQSFISKGYKETITIGREGRGPIRVAIKKHDTKEDALEALQKYRDELKNQSIWILEY